jgi:hypothetical protein
MEHMTETQVTISILDAAETGEIVPSESVETKAISGTRPKSSTVTHRGVVEKDNPPEGGSRGSELSSKDEIRATDEALLKKWGSRDPNLIERRSPVKPERRKRGNSFNTHLSTLKTIRLCMGEEDQTTQKGLADYFGFNQLHLPSDSEMLDLVWYQYPPRAMLKAQVYDIYSDHAERSEISVGNIERT